MIFYLLSPENIPPNPVLFPNMVPTFISKGHTVTDNIGDSDCVLFDLHVRTHDYKKSDIDWILQSNVMVATFDEWDRGNMSDDRWPHPLTDQQHMVFNHIKRRENGVVHFSRLLDKTKTYTHNLYPYEKPISYQEKQVTPDELFNRPYDVAFIANYSPSRERIAKALESDKRLKCVISLGGTKIEFNDFLEIHKKAKMFVSSGAGGFTDERKQLLFSVAGLIQERNNQLLLHEFVHLWNCIKINNRPEPEDLETIFEVVNNKNRLYNIYKYGVAFMQTFYSASYIANDILEKILKHA